MASPKSDDDAGQLATLSAMSLWFLGPRVRFHLVVAAANTEPISNTCEHEARRVQDQLNAPVTLGFVDQHVRVDFLHPHPTHPFGLTMATRLINN
jgi:hypothetical protein